MIWFVFSEWEWDEIKIKHWMKTTAASGNLAPQTQSIHSPIKLMALNEFDGMNGEFALLSIIE